MESGNRYIRNNFEQPSSVTRLFVIVSLPRHLSYHLRSFGTYPVLSRLISIRTSVYIFDPI
jgi:hypothetical protein